MALVLPRVMEGGEEVAALEECCWWNIGFSARDEFQREEAAWRYAPDGQGEG